jgi:hypothetical protein
VLHIALIILAIYFIGCAFLALHSIHLWAQMLGWKKHGISDIIDSHSNMKPWLINRVIWWPYFLFIRTNPLVLLSELFFSRYGDKGHKYFGTKGLKNILNDIFRGFGRYKKYTVKTASIKIDEENLYNLKQNLFFPDAPKYTHVIIAKYKKTYLFKVNFSSVNDCKATVSRYELDDCQHLTKEQIISSINELNPNLSIKLIISVDG